MPFNQITNNNLFKELLPTKSSKSIYDDPSLILGSLWLFGNIRKRDIFGKVLNDCTYRDRFGIASTLIVIKV